MRRVGFEWVMAAEWWRIRQGIDSLIDLCWTNVYTYIVQVHCLWRFLQSAEALSNPSPEDVSSDLSMTSWWCPHHCDVSLCSASDVGNSCCVSGSRNKGPFSSASRAIVLRLHYHLCNTVASFLYCFIQTMRFLTGSSIILITCGCLSWFISNEQ